MTRPKRDWGGRPKLSAERKLCKATIYLRPGTLRQLAKAAKERDTTAMALMRLLVERGLRKL